MKKVFFILTVNLCLLERPDMSSDGAGRLVPDELSWQTQMESKNQGFGIERRIDPDTSFTTAGFVDSQAVNGFHGSSVSVILWPNPNNGRFTVTINGNTRDKELVITNMQGKTVRRVIVNGNEQVHIYGLAAGAYDVTIPDAMGSGGILSRGSW